MYSSESTGTLTPHPYSILTGRLVHIYKAGEVAFGLSLSDFVQTCLHCMFFCLCWLEIEIGVGFGFLSYHKFCLQVHSMANLLCRFCFKNLNSVEKFSFFFASNIHIANCVGPHLCWWILSHYRPGKHFISSKFLSFFISIYSSLYPFLSILSRSGWTVCRSSLTGWETTCKLSSIQK